MGNKKQTIIILNGKHYDALTGAIVEPNNGAKAVRPIMDIAGGGTTKTVTPVARKATQPLAAAPAGPKAMDVARATGHVQPRKPQKAATLVRTAVKKPAPGLKRQTKVVAATNTSLPVLATVEQKWPVAHINPTRLKRAEHVAKSSFIQKFSATSAVSQQATSPVEQATPAAAPTPVQATQNKSMELFERAIANADTHERPMVNQKKLARTAKRQAKQASRAKPVHHRTASIVAASVAVLAITGFVGYQNKTNLTMRFATAEAGFNAKLPQYQPTGYGLGNLSYSAGNVGASFHNDASKQSYNITQQTTKWDSQALLDNFVTTNYRSYQTLQSGEQIIFIYGNNDASWIKDGVWYRLTSNGSLSTSQILNIAASV